MAKMAESHTSNSAGQRPAEKKTGCHSREGGNPICKMK
jgi:hypothetical protein